MSDARPGMSTDLEWLVDVLWGGLDGVEVTLGAPPRGRRAAESYLVVPSARRPRVLLPVEPRLAWAALRAGGATRSRRAARERVMAGVAIRSGFARSFDRLSVHVASDGDDPASPSGVLAEVLGDEVRLAVNVRPPGPYRKAVAQAVRADGRVLAYAKVAWDEVTDANVRAEADALEAAARIGDVLGAPRILSRTTWRGRSVLVTEPMPGALRRYEPRAGAPPAELSRAVAGLFGSGAAPFADGPIASRLRGRLDAVIAAGGQPEIAGAAGGLLAAAESDARSLAYGGWHGDWSPWNLAHEGERLWAWDWEYARGDVPLGLDAVHFHAQVAFARERRGLAASLAHAATASAPALRDLGHDEASSGLVHTVYLLEMTLRHLEAIALGAAANPRFIAEAERALRTQADRAAGS